MPAARRLVMLESPERLPSRQPQPFTPPPYLCTGFTATRVPARRTLQRRGRPMLDRADGPRAGRISYGTYRSLPRSGPGTIWHRVSRKDHGCDFLNFVGERLFGTMRPAARPGNADPARSWRHTDHSACPEAGRPAVRARDEIGQASYRERVCRSVKISVVAE